MTLTNCALIRRNGDWTGRGLRQGTDAFAADTAVALCLLFSSPPGVPVSTAHAKTTAIMGVDAAYRLKSVSRATVKKHVLTGVLTFPGCSIAGHIIA